MQIDAQHGTGIEQRKVNRTLQWQGQLFSVIALAAAVTALLVPRMAPSGELLLIGVLIVLVGVPHGAVDTVFARTRYDLSSWQRWLGFTLAYVGVMCMVVLLWVYSPSFFLLGFLLLSGAHFSGDPTTGTPALSRIAYGGAVLVVPSLRFGPELSHLFSVLVGADAAASVAPWISAASGPWVCLLAVCSLYESRRSRRTALEFAAVGALALCVSPLLGFTIFFCGMHSARHIIRTLNLVGPAQRKTVATAGVLPMIGVIGVGALMWWLQGAQPIETKLVQLLFVGLAALTVPHMLIVEPFRLRGWSEGAEGSTTGPSAALVSF